MTISRVYRTPSEIENQQKTDEQYLQAYKKSVEQTPDNCMQDFKPVEAIIKRYGNDINNTEPFFFNTFLSCVQQHYSAIAQKSTKLLENCDTNPVTRPSITDYQNCLTHLIALQEYLAPPNFYGFATSTNNNILTECSTLLKNLRQKLSTYEKNTRPITTNNSPPQSSYIEPTKAKVWTSQSLREKIAQLEQAAE